MKLKKLFVSLFIVNIFSLSLVVFIVNDYNNAIQKLEDAYKMQHKSVLLVEELRQSSDDLTRVARTYVITGNNMYKEQFQTILDIRNGIKPRPKNYNKIYWDFLTLENSKPILDGETIALRDLMKQAGFKDDELSLLYKSQKESDKLTSLEAKAMNAVKGIFQDKDGNYTLKSKPNLKLAGDIMHSNEYHKAKILIMKPLNEFYTAFEIRTNEKVQDAHESVQLLEKYVSYAILFLIVLVLSSFFIIISRIIYPLEALRNIMLRLSDNDMDVEIPERENNDEVGEMTGTVEIFKSNAIKLIQSEKKNQLLLDLAGEGIFGLDQQGQFTFLNPMACKLLGYKNQNELIGKYIHKTILTNEKYENYKLEDKLMLNKIENIHLRNKNNHEFPIDYVSTPIYNKLNLLDGSVVVFSDITNRKKNEDKLKEAIKSSKAANHSKSIFLANMSHELRTPLNAILGFTQLLKESQNINNQEKDNLKTIQNSGEHLLTIINEILELSKIEAGKIDIILNDFDLYKSLKDLENMFKTRFINKEIDFVFNIETNIPKYIKSDEKRLRQIIINLLGNALKFTDKGKVNLNVYIKNTKLFIDVIDTGIGIEDKNIDLIFKPFEQVNIDKYTKNSTGLGLSITKKLIKKMGGDIFVESKINKGSKFSFYVEFEHSQKTNSDNNIEKNKIIGIKNKIDELTILVVDDLEENRRLLVQILHKYGFNTIEASNGKDAIDMLNKYNISLIFMDILMPKIDGIQTTKTIRKTVKGKDIPIIIVSAHVFKEDENKAFEAGASSFLSKPINQDAILSSLEKYLNIDFVYKNKNDLYEEIISKEDLVQIKESAQELDIKKLESLISKIKINNDLKKSFQEALLVFNFSEIINLCNNIDKRK